MYMFLLRANDHVEHTMTYVQGPNLSESDVTEFDNDVWKGDVANGWNPHNEYSGSVWVVKNNFKPWVFAASSFYLFLVGFLGILFNATIILMYITIKKLQTEFNLLLVNVVLVQFLVSIYGIPVDLLATYRNGWDMGKELCITHGFLLTFLGMTTINSMTVISAYRWIMVTRKDFVLRNSNLVVKGMVMWAWVWSFLLALPPLLGWGTFTVETNGITCSPSWFLESSRSYNLALFMVGFFSPCGIICVCSVGVMVSLKKNVRGINSANIRYSANKKERKVLTMVLFMVALFVICWSPYATVSMAGILGLAKAIPSHFTLLPLLFAKSSILCNPIILIFMNASFQSAFFSLLPNFEVMAKKNTSPKKASKIELSNRKATSGARKLKMSDESVINIAQEEENAINVIKQEENAINVIKQDQNVINEAVKENNEKSPDEFQRNGERKSLSKNSKICPLSPPPGDGPKCSPLPGDGPKCSPLPGDGPKCSPLPGDESKCSPPLGNEPKFSPAQYVTPLKRSATDIALYQETLRPKMVKSMSSAVDMIVSVNQECRTMKQRKKMWKNRFRGDSVKLINKTWFAKRRKERNMSLMSLQLFNKSDHNLEDMTKLKSRKYSNV